MSALASSPSHSSHRRHARRLNTQTKRHLSAVPSHAAALTVVPAQQHHNNPVIASSGTRSFWLALSAIALVHIAIAAYVSNAPEPELIKAEIPPMTLDFYRPPAEPVVQEPQPEPVPEPPPPVVKKPEPKPVEKKPEPVPTPVETPVAVEPVAVETPPVVETPPAPPAPVLVEASADAGYLKNPAPRYPDFAAQKGWEGTVLLQVHVLANGKPKAVEIKQSSGRKLLDNAAIQAVRRWTFVAATLDGVTTDSWVEVPIDFKLSH